MYQNKYEKVFSPIPFHLRQNSYRSYSNRRLRICFTMVKSVLQLKCQCNNYPWGKKGSASRAAQLCAETPGTDFGIDEEKYYAEMWMGTYPELPSYVLETGEDLQDVINANTHQLLGESVYQSFGNDLPFLPKVLSIAKALPLQLHPVRSPSIVALDEGCKH